MENKLILENAKIAFNYTQLKPHNEDKVSALFDIAESAGAKHTFHLQSKCSKALQVQLLQAAVPVSHAQDMFNPYDDDSSREQ